MIIIISFQYDNLIIIEMLMVRLHVTSQVHFYSYCSSYIYSKIIIIIYVGHVVHFSSVAE